MKRLASFVRCESQERRPAISMAPSSCTKAKATDDRRASVDGVGVRGDTIRRERTEATSHDRD